MVLQVIKTLAIQGLAPSTPEAGRRNDGWVDVLQLKRGVERIRQQQISGEQRRACCALYPVATLRCYPEKTLRLRIPADHEVSVCDKRAQAGPSVRRSPNIQRSRGRDLMNSQGNVQLFCHYIMRVDGIGVGRRAKKLTGIGLEVIGFVYANDGRPLFKHLWRNGFIGLSVDSLEGKRRPAFGLQADMACAKLLGDLLRPCAGPPCQASCRLSF